MLSEKTYKIWRITNLGLIFIGLITPWLDISFEVTPMIVYGWEFFYWTISIFAFDIPTAIKDGLNGIAILEFFSSLSGIFLAYYLLYNTYAVLNPSRRNRIISMILVAFLAVDVFSATIGGMEKMLLGLYFFAIGVSSAALLEWQSK
jgi:hypothetical protein